MRGWEAQLCGTPAKAQRSGFGRERRSSEMSEISPEGGIEGYGACDAAGRIEGELKQKLMELHN